MKIRNGFVSNSSSSSFLIAVPKGKPTKEQMREHLGVVPGTPAAKLVEPFVSLLCKGEKYSIEQLLENYGYETVEQFKAEYTRGKTIKTLKLLQDGWSVYEVTVSSEDWDDVASLFLYQHEGALDCDTDNLKIITY